MSGGAEPSVLRRLVRGMLFPAAAVRRTSWAIFGLLIAAMILLSPYLQLPQDVAVVSNDKLMHLFAFAGYGALAWVGFGGRRTVLPILVAVGIGVLDEVVQHFMPARHASITDIVADAVGATLAVLLLTLLRSVATRRPTHPASAGRS
jgi:VanZ family protein